MPLDMRILESRDPDGRLAEAIKHGRKVNSSDYDALVTHSKKYLQPKDGDLAVPTLSMRRGSRCIIKWAWWG